MGTYSIQSDIFALGVVLLELCCPFSTMMERSQVLTAIRHGVVPQQALKKYPAEMALVLRMTALEPTERPSAAEVLECVRHLVRCDRSEMEMALDDLKNLQSVRHHVTLTMSMSLKLLC